MDPYPDDKNDRKPHERFMDMKTLAVHVVEIFTCPQAIMETRYLDAAYTPYTQPPIKAREECKEKLYTDYETGRRP